MIFRWKGKRGEGWKRGRMEGWKDGRVEEWKGGRKGRVEEGMVEGKEGGKKWVTLL